MSKHQSCAICKRDFVGSDANIGENLCRECDDELHGDYNAELATLTAERDELRKRLELRYTWEREMSALLNMECYSATLVKVEVEELLKAHSAAKAERDELLKTVERLPKTADGVPVSPGMVVYYSGEAWIVFSVSKTGTLQLECVGDPTHLASILGSHCYSTESAAIAAGET